MNPYGNTGRVALQNWNCDGAGPHASGTVKLYPLGGGANLILCAYCWERENLYRKRRGRETGAPENWPFENWDAGKVYQTD
jgi:hypothetical protein